MAHIQIDDIDPIVTYTVGGVSRTDFAVPFAFFENSDLVVTVNGTALTLSDYTVTGAGVSAGGLVVLNTGVTSSEVVIERILPIERVTDFPNSGPLDITALNTQLDKVISICQQLQTSIAAAGQRFTDWIAVITTALTSDAVTVNFATFNSIALTNVSVLTSYIRTAGYAAAGDGGGALYKWVASEPSCSAQAKTQSLNGRWFQLAETIFNVKFFGAVGDTSADDTPSIQAALDDCPLGGTVYFPTPTSVASGYKVIGSGSQCLSITKGITLAGDGHGSMIFLGPTVPNTRDGIKLNPSSAGFNFGMRDLRIFGDGAGGVGRHGLACDFTTAGGSFQEINIHNVRIDELSGGNSIYSVGGGWAYSQIEDSNLSSISLTDAGDGLTIRDNILSGTLLGIYIAQVIGAGGLRIRDNVIANKAGMITIDRAQGPIIEGNELEQAFNCTQANGAMLDIDGAVATVNRPLIINNSIAINSGVTGVTAPIRVDAAANAVIDGNVILGRGSSHIVVTANATDTFVGPGNQYQTNNVIVVLALTDAGTRTLYLGHFAGSLTENTATMLTASTFQIDAHSGYGSTGFAQGTTNYIGPQGEGSSNATTETPISASLAWQKLYVKCSTVGGSGQTVTFTLQKNGVDTALTCAIVSGATTASDTTHFVTYAPGDTWSIKVVTSATTGTVTSISAGMAGIIS